MPNRREILRSAIAMAAAATLPATAAQPASRTPSASRTNAPAKGGFWPNDARLVISISMQFEATSQPAGADSPFPRLEGYPDTVAPTWYRYGMEEGVPRMLELWDRHAIKVTSHMVGLAVEHYPELAREIVRRGHEAAGHGQSWTPQYSMSPDDERASYLQSADTIERITGARPTGFNAYWMQHSRHTLEILQDLGFLYHVDDLARDEPSVTPVRGKPFVVVPYTVRNNDIGRFSDPGMTAAAFTQELKDELDVLYAEGANRRRMMSISMHDRIGGTPRAVHALEQFILYAKSKPGVAFMRKDQIARWVIAREDVPRNPERKFDGVW